MIIYRAYYSEFDGGYDIGFFDIYSKAFFASLLDYMANIRETRIRIDWENEIQDKYWNKKDSLKQKRRRYKQYVIKELEINEICGYAIQRLLKEMNE